MRYKNLVVMALSLLMVGGSCLPLFSLDPDPGVPTGHTLSVAVTKPDADRVVSLGTPVEIEWSAANLTGSEAVATVLVRWREDASLPEYILKRGGLGDPNMGNPVDWDTSDFPGGLYDVLVRVEVDGRTKQASAPNAFGVTLHGSISCYRSRWIRLSARARGFPLHRRAEPYRDRRGTWPTRARTCW